MKAEGALARVWCGETGLGDPHELKPRELKPRELKEGEMIGWVDNIGIAVRDLPRMMQFYTKVLGLSGEMSETDGWITLDKVSLYLFVTTNPEATQAEHQTRTADLTKDPPGIDHIAFGVANLDDASAELERRGVVFAGPAVGEPGQLRYRGFCDPEGNMLYLVERPM